MRRVGADDRIVSTDEYTMQVPGLPPSMAGMRLAPAVMGAALIGIGTLIFIMPQLVSYLIAATFVMVGCSLLGVAWRMKPNVTFRRFNDNDS